MNSVQYLDELRRQLQGLPQEEIDSCFRYYGEYLADAGPDQQEAAMERLGPPSRLRPSSRRIGLSDPWRHRKRISPDTA